MVLDASMALAWHLERQNPDEAALARLALQEAAICGADVPALWYPEVANGLLVAERRRVTDAHEIAVFRNDLAHLIITLDSALLEVTLTKVLSLARLWGLTAYDATYLELVLRTGGMLATFDQKLADAARRAGVRVFGDAA
jgi:predicted nucleic acid-binding protein